MRVIGPFHFVLFYRLRAVDEVDDQICLRCRLLAALDTFFFDGVIGVTQAGGINDHDWDSSNIGRSLYGITRGTRLRRNNCSFLVQEAIQKARFSCIGLSNDGQPKPMAKQLALFCRSKQGLHGFFAILQPGQQLTVGIG